MVLKGARQVGKTWLMKEFGRLYYTDYFYFNFDEEDELRSIFEANKNPQRIIELLSMISGRKILPGDTLIIFDEIQECPEALNTLKYFKENANEYHVIAAGSLPGTMLAQPKSYPVGMINLQDIYPLSFDEFLEMVQRSSRWRQRPAGINQHHPLKNILLIIIRHTLCVIQNAVIERTEQLLTCPYILHERQEICCNCRKVKNNNTLFRDHLTPERMSCFRIFAPVFFMPKHKNENFNRKTEGIFNLSLIII